MILSLNLQPNKELEILRKLRRKPLPILITLLLFTLLASGKGTYSQAQSTTTISANLGSHQINLGDEISIEISIAGGSNIYGFDLTINYDPSLLSPTEEPYQIGDFLGTNPLVIVPQNQASGSFRLAASRTGTVGGSSGSGTLYRLRFRTLAPGTATLNFEGVMLIDDAGQPLPGPELKGTTVEILAPPTPPTPSPGEASLYISPSEGNYYLGDQPATEIILDTQDNPASGADVILHFDPARWEVAQINPGSIFANYPQKTFDNQNGIIRISGTANYGQYFTGRGMLAQIIWEIKSIGPTTLEFEFTPGSTTDCNIVSALTGQELLTKEPPTASYTFIFEPTLNLQYNLPYRLSTVGSAAEIEISTEDQAFKHTAKVGKDGILKNLDLSELEFGHSYRFIIKIKGFLKKKAKELVTIRGGTNPSSGILDFGNLYAGDLNNDDIINNFDLAELFDSWGKAGPADFNGDQTVNNFDAWVTFANFFKEAE